MTNLSKETLDYIRELTSQQNIRPIEALMFIDPLYPNSTLDHQVSLTSTQIGITRATATPYMVDYVGKSLRQVSAELNNSPFPIVVKAASNIGSLQTGELIVDGAVIPTSFKRIDRALDGKAAIVRAKRWSVNFRRLSSIILRAPYEDEPTLPWWARIGVGKFIQKQNGITYYFDVPEYKDQAWSPNYGAPFRDIEGEAIRFIEKNAFRVARTPLLTKNSNLVVVSSDGNHIFHGSIIKYIDDFNGIVYLHDGHNIPEGALVYYTYLEQNYLYKDMNINGHFKQNPFVLDKYILFYALPVKSNSGISRSRGIYHVVSDSIPAAVSQISNASSTEPVAIIGAVNVKPFINRKSINVIDTRSYGGGLREDKVGVTAEKRFKESQYFNDIGRMEGIPYPGNGSVVVELPQELKEVLPIHEIKKRAQKFIAAGVYPIYNFSKNQAKPSTYAADISSMGFNPVAADSTSGSAGWWVNSDLALPDSIYSGYTTGDLAHGPILDVGENKVIFEEGNIYTQTFLRSSAPAYFAWEERTVGTEWAEKSWIDQRTIGSGLITAGEIGFSAEYGRKEIRNFRGFAPFRLDQTEHLYKRVARSAASIIENTEALSVINATGSYAVTTGQVANVVNATTESKGIVQAGVDPMYEPLLLYYEDTTLGTNFLKNKELAAKNVQFFYDSLSGGWPREFEDEVFGTLGSSNYWAMKDVYTYAVYTKGRMNAVGTTTGASINIDSDAAYGHSGVWTLLDTLEEYSTGHGLGQAIGIQDHVRLPVYIPSSYTGVALLTGGSAAEANRTLSNTYLNTEYIPAYAAAYATQVQPRSGGEYHPGIIAMSGIAVATPHFNSQYRPAEYGGTGAADTWLTKYNRLSELASRHLYNCTTAFDSLYYGNNEWAGYTGYETKLGPLSGSGPEFEKDLGGEETVVWGDGTYFTWSASFTKAIDQLNKNLAIVGDDLTSISRHGGIMEPGVIDAARAYLWLPKHFTERDPLFYPDYAETAEAHVSIFEESMSALLRGSVSKDGILSEGGSFRLEPAPFSGHVPSKLFEAAADAIAYYRATGDVGQEEKWLGLAEGMFNTTENLYAFDGGYPANSVFTAQDAAGDPGSKPLMGYMALLSQNPNVFTDEEIRAITGDIGRAY